MSDWEPDQYIRNRGIAKELDKILSDPKRQENIERVGEMLTRWPEIIGRASGDQEAEKQDTEKKEGRSL